MRRYRTEIDNVRAHLRSLWAVIGTQFVVILARVSVVCPTSRILSFTEPPAKSIGAHVSEFSVSSVCPLAAVLLSFKVNSKDGSVSPTTNFIVSE